MLVIGFSRDVSAVFQGGQGGGSSGGWCLPLRSFEMVQYRVVPQKSCIWMAEECASKLSTGELTEFFSTLRVQKLEFYVRLAAFI